MSQQAGRLVLRGTARAALALCSCAALIALQASCGGEQGVRISGTLLDGSFTTGPAVGAGDAGLGDAGSGDGGGLDGGFGDGGLGDGGLPDGGPLFDAGPGALPSPDCFDLVPASIGPSVTQANVQPGSAFICSAATTDGLGDVASEVHDGAPSSSSTAIWQVWSAGGTPLGSFTALEALPASVGFHALERTGTSPSSTLTALLRGPDGAAGIGFQTGGDTCSANAFPDQIGGALVLTRCLDAGAGTTHGSRFNAQGGLLGRVQIANGTVAVAGAIEVGNATFVIFYPGNGVGLAANSYAGRWYDGAMAPLTDFFTVLADQPVFRSTIVRPLLFGGVAVQVGGFWSVVIAAASTTPAPVPIWLALRPGTGLELVRGHRAYAVVPLAGTSSPQLEIVSPSGNGCGALVFPVDSVTIGPLDGTVIGSSGPGGCTHTWWPSLLR